MSSLLGVTMSPAVQFIASFAFVIALIVVTLILARNFGLFPNSTPRLGRVKANRLSISEVMALDTRRKLVLVRRDGVEHLLLLGGSQDVIIETAIEKPAQSQQVAEKRAFAVSAKAVDMKEDEGVEPILPAFNDEGYKITSWSIPATSGVAPQIHLSNIKQQPNVTPLHNQGDAQQELRPSIEDENSNAQQEPAIGTAIGKLVEQARDAAIAAMDMARGHTAEVLQNAKPISLAQDKPSHDQHDEKLVKSSDIEIATVQDGTAVEATEERSSQVQLSDGIAVAIAPETDKATVAVESVVRAPQLPKMPKFVLKAASKPEIAARVKLSTENYVEKTAALNAAMEAQIRALTQLPNLNALPENVVLHNPTLEDVANANQPQAIDVIPQSDQLELNAAEGLASPQHDISLEEEIANHLLVDEHLSMSKPVLVHKTEQSDGINTSNVVSISSDAAKNSTTDLAFYSVFGVPESVQDQNDDAEEEEQPKADANLPRSYVEVLEAASPKMKPRLKKAPIQKSEPEVERDVHPNYMQKPKLQPVQKALSDEQFDELEMELAKLLQAPQGRR